jgi:hypothetical protein
VRRPGASALLAGLLLVAGCVEPGATSLDDVRTDLAREGAVVRTIGTTIGLPFSVGPTRVEVDGREIRVFEYRDTALRESDSSAITMGGYRVHGSPVEWPTPPLFWAEGRVLVLYVGEDGALIDILTRVLGPPLDVGAA